MTMNLLTYNELGALPVGTRVVFPEAYDIYPYDVVKARTACTIKSNDLAANTQFGSIDLLPDDELLRTSLSEWDGTIMLTPLNDGLSLDDLSPVTVHT